MDRFAISRELANTHDDDEMSKRVIRLIHAQLQPSAP